MLPHYLDLTSEDDSLGIEFLRAGHTMNSNQMYKFKKMGESNKGTFKNNFGILVTKHFWFLCIVAKITPQYAAKVKHFLVGYGVVKPYEQKQYFCVAYFLKTCIEVCSRIEVLCFHWCTALSLYVFKTVNAASVRPDLQSLPPPITCPVDASRPWGDSFQQQRVTLRCWGKHSSLPTTLQMEFLKSSLMKNFLVDGC